MCASFYFLQSFVTLFIVFEETEIEVNVDVIHLDFKVRFGISEFKDTQLESFIEALKGHIYLLNLYYVVSDFNQHFYRPNANFGVISFEAINKPFMPYLIYLGVFLKVFLTT